MLDPFRRRALALAVALALPGAPSIAADPAPHKPQTPLSEWPRIRSAIAPDPALEARVAAIVGKMTLAQKIGQMTQAEIKSVTPDEVRQYYLGSVLNGGGSKPGNNKFAGPADWVKLADSFYDASMATDMAVKVPVIWGTDAVHGHNNVYGATIFPHNIGLGAAHDPALVGEIGAATGRAVRATGIAWVFGPTVAVVRDDRWGRTYEGFSEDPRLVQDYAGVYVKGLQGAFRDDANVIASIKHYMGDGGTENGVNTSVTRASEREMMNIHAPGYFSGLEAGAQTVMASFNSWYDTENKQDHGKLHGDRRMLTEILKDKMGFDGFVVTDWNGIGEVAGCRNDSCARAINAGVDMVMVPDDWKAFIRNTVQDVEAGRIPMARIDDAVTRIVRVKLRAGLFGQRPSANRYAGKPEALQARELARRAVRESLVLLKNEGPALPLATGRRLLVVGKAADSMMHQAGGWTLSWQGTDNTNADFPHGDTVLAGLREAAGAANVTYSADGKGVDPSRFDAVIAVIGEGPYAEGDGDIVPSGTLRHSSRYPEDLAVLQAVHGKGKPVITVLMSGRPLWVNDLLNLSDTFIAAWLPGSEGKGVSDLLVAAKGAKRYDFGGTLTYSWPKTVCQTPLNVGDAGYAPLFAYGYGLKAGQRSQLGRLDAAYAGGGCSASNTYPLHGQADRASFPLRLRSGAGVRPFGADLNATVSVPGASATVVQIKTQQDARLVTWTGPASFEAHGARPLALPAQAATDGVLRFDTMVQAAPAGKVTIAMGCAGAACGQPLDATRVFARLAGKGKQVVKIPLACFTAKGVDLARVDTPFSVTSTSGFAAAFGNVDVVGGAARDTDTVRCEELQ
ncbi:glycoside hydrolase family 3 N-terminal domain-containing protein [Herbaspirillum sp. SJZ107]|uniref:glycoside hydrolase family 3 protein n=1 Tax=Herbaspirillum sp. SJZ107 TaxID=2572881 RepID=UPI00114EBE49|nr:glycoside hydrolase family 3 N-terminal domain-containing protein [Herbaspirillum sp. SJZ107]TQK11697.1 beta-glucosidase [Herbaspirillum sp. SJZ107]